MDINLITQAIYTLAGLSALIVFVTQIFKNWWSKQDKKWVNHLLSFIASLLCNGAVLAIGGIWGVGLYAAFNFASVTSWLVWIATTLGCTLVANGMWSYEVMQMVLEWVKLIPEPKKKPSVMVTEKEIDPDMNAEG